MNEEDIRKINRQAVNIYKNIEKKAKKLAEILYKHWNKEDLK